MSVPAFEGLKTQTNGKINHYPSGVFVQRIEEDPTRLITYEAMARLSRSRPEPVRGLPNTVIQQVVIGQADMVPVSYYAKVARITDLRSMRDTEPGYTEAQKRIDLAATLSGILNDLALDLDNLKRVRMEIPDDETVAAAVFDAKSGFYSRRFTLDKRTLSAQEAWELWLDGSPVSLEYEILEEISVLGKAAANQTVELDPVAEREPIAA